MVEWNGEIANSAKNKVNGHTSPVKHDMKAMSLAIAFRLKFVSSGIDMVA